MLKPTGVLRVLIPCFTVFASIALSQGRSLADSFSLGVGLVYSTSVYRQVSDRFIPVPFIGLRYKRLSFRGLDLSYNMYRSKAAKFDVSFEPNFFAGYSPDDSPFLSGMQKRRGGADIALSSTFFVSRLQAKLKIARTVFAKHDGFQAAVSIGSGIPVSHFIKDLPFTLIKLSLGASYFDAKHSDYYFGVLNSEQSTARPAFSGKDALNIYSTLVVISQVSDTWSVQAIYNIEYLSKRIRRSPLVDKVFDQSAILGLSYSFL